MTLAEIRADFELLDDWEDRYRYIIELGRKLPPMPNELKTEASKVRGCASQVWLVSHTKTAPDGSGHILTFEGDSDAHIVRGLIAILFSIYAGMSPAEIVSHDAEADFTNLDLKEHLTPQRSNGLASMVERIRTDARNSLAGTASS